MFTIIYTHTSKNTCTPNASNHTYCKIVPQILAEGIFKTGKRLFTHGGHVDIHMRQILIFIEMVQLKITIS